MVSKKCVMCGSYFAGDLDGDYTCPRCEASGAPRRLPDWQTIHMPDDVPPLAPRAKTNSHAA